ncbi:MAG: hypothetical protein AAFR65_09080 [Pseudomonadota bacterium]
MNLRKRTIAGIAAVAVIFVGAFAEAMFSEGGVGGLARGWDAIGSFVRPSPEKRTPRPAEKPRFARWAGPEPTPVHPIGDANAKRGEPGSARAEGLDGISAVSREPLDFDPWAEDDPADGADDPVGSIAELVSQGGEPGQGAERGGGGRSGGAPLSGVGASGSSPSLHSVAFAAIGGRGGAGGFADPTAGFGGIFSSAESDVVATPLPPSAVLFFPALAALIGRWRRLT